MILVQGAGSGGVRVGFIYFHNMYNHNDVGKGEYIPIMMRLMK